MKSPNERRRFVLRAAAGFAALVTAGCERLSRTEWFPKVLAVGESLSSGAQHLISPRKSMAQEFSEADLSPQFRSNGTSMPNDEGYQALAAKAFADWALQVDGLVANPLKVTLAELRKMPARTQITRHDCVEGWSAIGKWTGAPLSLILKSAGMAPSARYVVFHCADDLEETKDGSGRYYESVDLIDAFHPQTILAYELNDAPLPVEHGAPVRMRIERQ